MRYTRIILTDILPIVVAIACIMMMASLKFSIPVQLSRLALILVVDFWLIRLFMRFVKAGGKGLAMNTLLVTMTGWVTLSVLELAFMFIPRSHGVGYTLGSKVWFGYYWNPLNSFGYRDKEPDLTKPSVLFLGDSFTAGHGIRQTGDRFSDQVGKQLHAKGSKLNVVNLGKNGSDTRKEYRNLVSYLSKVKTKPEWVVLQYFGNDIEEAARFSINIDSILQLHKPSIAERIFNYSYLANYIYWTYPHADMKPYFEVLQKAYTEDAILNEHYKDLNKIIALCQDQEIKLIAVIFPFMHDPAVSKALYSEKVGQYLRDRGTAVIDPSDLIRKIPMTDRVVNSNDLHASVYVNRLIADEIVRVMQGEESTASSWDH